MGNRRCVRCKRTGLNDDDFPTWERGTINTCKLCLSAKSKREYAHSVATVPGFLENEAARLRDYRERKKRSDPNYLQRERQRAAANRERTKHEHAA